MHFIAMALLLFMLPGEAFALGGGIEAWPESVRLRCSNADVSEIEPMMLLYDEKTVYFPMSILGIWLPTCEATVGADEAVVANRNNTVTFRAGSAVVKIDTPLGSREIDADSVYGDLANPVFERAGEIYVARELLSMIWTVNATAMKSGGTVVFIDGAPVSFLARGVLYGRGDKTGSPAPEDSAVIGYTNNGMEIRQSGAQVFLISDDGAYQATVKPLDTTN